jgi:thioesterase domain-containing protein/acyl carrier protein
MPKRPEARPSHLPPPTEPSDKLEQILVAIWESELGLAPIGVDDDYFQLDGDSLSALNIFTAFEAETEIHLRPSLLIEYPTIRGIVSVLRKDLSFSDDGYIVNFRADGDRPPIFFVAGAGGEVLFLRDLSMALDDGVPLHGVLPLNPRQPFTIGTSIEERSAVLVSAIRAVRPAGPYIIGGYSLGGVFAYEIMQQLTAAGESVPLVILLDAMNAEDQTPSRRALGVLRLLLHSGRTGKISDVVPYFREKALVLSFRLPLLGPSIRRWHRRTRSFSPHLQGGASHGAIRAAYVRYRPRPSKGRVVIYASEESRIRYGAADLGWGRAGVRDPEVVEIPGNHLDMITKDVVAHYAKHLCGRIEELGQSTSTNAAADKRKQGARA